MTPLPTISAMAQSVDRDTFGPWSTVCDYGPLQWYLSEVELLNGLQTGETVLEFASGNVGEELVVGTVVIDPTAPRVMLPILIGPFTRLAYRAASLLKNNGVVVEFQLIPKGD